MVERTCTDYQADVIDCLPFYVGKWTIPHLVGQRPPPCGGVTFTMIDPHRALLFGGRQETGRVSSVYIFDFRDLVRRSVTCTWNFINYTDNHWIEESRLHTHS